ncbi:MAG: hypothetical protein IJM30_04215 [Thermoguttaceae bacterium]|nr:hypothetical protein [Thermoguttaceae bacterium]
MSAIYFTNNADSGDGSLRAALSGANEGDVVLPSDFSTGDVEILLASPLPNRSATIRGSANRRIVLNGSGARDFLRASSASLDLSFEFVDFKNGYRADAAPVYASAFARLRFANCRFTGGVGNYAGFLQATGTASGSISLESCVSYGNAPRTGSYPALLFLARAFAGTVAISGCSLAESREAISYAGSEPDVLTIVDSLATGFDGFEPSTAGFVDLEGNDFRLTGASPYRTGANLSGVDFLGIARETNGSVGAYEGTYFVAKPGETTTLSQDLVVDRLEAPSGAIVVMLGAERRLAATKSAAIGNAVFRAADGGYLAIPASADGELGTYVGVALCACGAGLTDFRATAIGPKRVALEWVAANPSAPVYLERLDPDGPVPLEGEPVDSRLVVAAPSGRATYRAYDGLSLLTDDAWTVSGVQFKVKAIWATAERASRNWEVIAQMATAAEKVFTGQSVTILARIFDAFDESAPLLNDGNNVVSVRYACYYDSNGLFAETSEPIPGRENVDAGTDCVLEALQTSDAWTVDQVGYNFVLTPDVRTSNLFEKPGRYRIKVVITLAEGNPIVFYVPLDIVERE